MPAMMSKANGRQSSKRKSAYDTYRNTSVREKNAMRRLLRHAERYNYTTAVGSNHGHILFNNYIDSTRHTIDDCEKAWARCANKTGVAVARGIYNEYVLNE